MNGVPPAPGSPLEWWEHAQIDILLGIDAIDEAEAAHLRETPDDWRALREKIRERFPPKSERG